MEQNDVSIQSANPEHIPNKANVFHISPELQAELDTLPYNPNIPSWPNPPDTTVEVEGKSENIHFTNSFWLKFSSFFNLQSGQTERISAYDIAFEKALLVDYQYPKIFKIFETHYPNLFEKLTIVNDEYLRLQRQHQETLMELRNEDGVESEAYKYAVQERPRPLEELQSLRDLLFSKAYQGVYPIAKQVGGQDYDCVKAFLA